MERSIQPWVYLASYARQVKLSKLNNFKIHIYDAGSPSAPAMLLVHGLGDDADTWRHIIPEMAKHARVIAVDLPGFGRSAPMPPNADASMHLYVLRALMDELGIHQVSLVGHSMGAMLCHWLALDKPNNIRSLVLIGGSLYMKDLKIQPQTLLFFLPGIGRWMLTRYRKSEKKAFESLRPYFANLDSFPEEEQAFLQERVNWRVHSEEFIHAYLRSIRSLPQLANPMQEKLPGRLTKNNIPTLLVYGEKDELVSPDNLRSFSKLEPGIQVKAFGKAGHNLQQEHPQLLLLAMEEAEGIME